MGHHKADTGNQGIETGICRDQALVSVVEKGCCCLDEMSDVCSRES
jgi:hypothetical protein